MCFYTLFYYFSFLGNVTSRRKRRQIARSLTKQRKVPKRENPKKTHKIRDPVSRDIEPEIRNSITPGNNALAFWTIGGSTVMTNEKVRLTPSSSGKRGWIWNQQHITSQN